MYRLLIVDDEPYTVDGLHEMLQESGLEDLDLYRAYSALEAIEWLNRVKIDLVLSDIRMPGMDGLQLLREIRARWPRCKVVFLTGMNDAHYVRQALRDGSIDYILKTEGDEPIIQRIRSAQAALEVELHNDQFLQQARARIRQAVPDLRHSWYQRLLLYGGEYAGLSQHRLDELESSLVVTEPLLTVLMRIDRWPEGKEGTDRQLLLYAIENITAEWLADVRLQSVLLEDSYFMLLIQPVRNADNQAVTDELERAALRFVKGTLETIQESCAQLLKLPVSFICSHHFVAWEQLVERYLLLRQQLVLGIGTGESMLLLAKREEEPATAHGMNSGILRERLDAALEGGRPEEARAVIASWFKGITEYSHYLEAYYTVANQLIGIMNRMDWIKQLEKTIKLEQLMNIQAHAARQQAVLYLQDAAERLAGFKQSLQEERTDRIVEKINSHIRDHIHGDVSLTALAEVVYLNPAYLSVLYKQMTGENISDYITRFRLEKATRLLQSSPLKIHEVAAEIGFDNAGYFTRFFRKHLGVGPQEYREKANV